MQSAEDEWPLVEEEKKPTRDGLLSSQWRDGLLSNQWSLVSELTEK